MQNIWTALARRKSIFLGFGILFLLCAAWVSAMPFSDSYKECKGNRAAEYAAPDKPSHDEKITTFYRCQGVALDANEGLLTALSTVAIGAFTLTLWLVTEKSLRLAREEFLASHRPKIRVRGVAFDDKLTNETNMAVSFTCVNIGDSPCEILDVRYAFNTASKPHEPVQVAKMSQISLPKPVILEPG